MTFPRVRPSFSLWLTLILQLAAASAAELGVGSKAPPLDIEHWIQKPPRRGAEFAPITEFESGKIFVIEFWATWCPPCRTSMPHLAELLEDDRTDDAGDLLDSWLADAKSPAARAWLTRVQRGLAMKAGGPRAVKAFEESVAEATDSATDLNELAWSIEQAAARGAAVSAELLAAAVRAAERGLAVEADRGDLQRGDAVSIPPDEACRHPCRAVSPLLPTCREPPARDSVASPSCTASVRRSTTTSTSTHA